MLSRRHNCGKMPLFDKIRALINKNSITRFLTVLTVLFIFYNIPKEYLGETYPICLYRIILKQKCLGCGTTRAIWSIIHLRINDAIEYNRFIVISFPLMAGCIIYWINKKRKK
jgi:hypothetical protein